MLINAYFPSTIMLLQEIPEKVQEFDEDWRMATLILTLSDVLFVVLKYFFCFFVGLVAITADIQ